MFLSNIVPCGLLTIVAHICDKLTYKYVKTHTFSRSADGKIIKHEDHQESTEDQEQLSDHQNELLKIPMNAVRASMLSFGPIITFIILRSIMKKGFIRTEMFVTLICIMLGSRIVLTLSLLLKATEANQAEISQAKKRAKNLEWEQYHSFKARKAREQQALQNNEPQPGTSSNQILDPKLLEQIMEDDEDTSV